jgi:hypothetical protein
MDLLMTGFSEKDYSEGDLKEGAKVNLLKI